MDLSNLTQYIGGILVIIYVSYNVINKFLDETTGRKKKREAKQKEEFENFQKQITEIIAPMISPLGEQVNTIVNLNKEQTVILNNLVTSQKDVLRKTIMDIYHKYEDARALPETVREQLDELYKDYISLHGNSYITKRYNRMCKWETIYDVEENE